MKLKLINLGRNNVNKELEIKNPSFSRIYEEVGKHLVSTGIDFEETENANDPHTYNVLAGGRQVGQIWVEKPEYMILL